MEKTASGKQIAQTLTLRITDDGRGFKSAQTSAAKSREGYDNRLGTLASIGAGTFIRLGM